VKNHEAGGPSHALAAGAGSLIIGVTLPVLLTCWHTWPGGPGMVSMMGDVDLQQYRDGGIGQFLWLSAVLQVTALILCGPGAVILAAVIYANFREMYEHDDKVQSRQTPPFISMMLVGTVAAFLNLPAYASAEFVQPARMIILFIVAGATCGLWIGWQAWRATHPEERWLPKFSLATLLLLAIAWGGLMLIFAPER
jgi:hypothetical protein